MARAKRTTGWLLGAVAVAIACSDSGSNCAGATTGTRTAPVPTTVSARVSITVSGTLPYSVSFLGPPRNATGTTTEIVQTGLAAGDYDVSGMMTSALSIVVSSSSTGSLSGVVAAGSLKKVDGPPNPPVAANGCVVTFSDSTTTAQQSFHLRFTIGGTGPAPYC